LPIVDKNFFSESVREVDLVTGERGIGQVEVSFFEVSENNLKIDEDTTVPWKYQGQQGQDSIFKDETGNIWELNDESLSLIIIEENKKIIYTKVKN